MAIIKGSIMGKLQSEDPHRGILYVAMDKLKTREEIIQFFGEYVTWLSEAGFEEEAAKKNIGYVLDFYGEEVKCRWNNAIPGIIHPYVGA